MKPKNILVKRSRGESRYEFQFKLADLGLSHFKQNIAGEDPTDADSRGTRTCGAPESYRRLPNVTRSIDIWSLGCVFSEAVTWSVFGSTGLDKYRDARKDEVSKSPSFKDGDCFHDGEKVLQAVAKSHKKAIDGARRFDKLTEKIVGMISEHMLCENPQVRLSAWQLLAKSETILSSATEGSNRFLNTTFPINESFRRSTAWLPPQPPVLPPERTMPSAADYRPGAAKNEPKSSFTSIDSREHLSLDKNSTLTQPARERSHRTTSRNSYHTNHQRVKTEVGTRMHRPQAYGSFASSRTMDPQNRLGPEPQSSTESVISGDIQASSPIDNGTPPQSVPLKVRPSAQSQCRPPVDQEYNNDFVNGNPTRRGAHQSDSTSTSEVGSPNTLDKNLAVPQYSHANKNATPELETSEPGGQKELIPPTVTVAEAQQWKKWRKRKWKCGESNRYVHLRRYMNEIAKRDHMFIVDDSESMVDHWQQVKEILNLLIYMVKRADPDSVELSFTSSKKIHKSKTTKKLMKKVVPREKYLQGSGSTNIGSCLGDVLQSYRERLEHQTRSGQSQRLLRSRVRPLNIYILTDGI